MAASAIDEIGPWSEVKLDIVREYAQAYSKILSSLKKPKLHHVYIDAFAGAGVHLSRSTKEFVPGSPLNALKVNPPFPEYHFIDINQARVESLQQAAQKRANVFVHEGDCNQVLVEEVFPQVQFKHYRRGLCLLDPYGLHLDWKVIYTAGQMKSIEIFLNFPIMDMNMNVLKHDPQSVPPEQSERMTRFWGDESWKSAAYSTAGNLFGYEEKTNNQAVTDAFRKRLLCEAGFKHVSKPLAMRNSRDAVVYYLFFASPKPVALEIVKDIFKKHEKRL
ncbi:MAG: three-Cys-motif partner protein TcmP [Nitrospira sp. CR1.3]|nr:three-Cys-motif partner protein TcmP [Nitrospira sp. CR1.3]